MVVRCSSFNFKQHRLFKPEMNHIRRANGIATETQPKLGPKFGRNLFPVGRCLFVIVSRYRVFSKSWRRRVIGGAKTNARFRVVEKLGEGRVKRIRNCGTSCSSPKCFNGLWFLFVGELTCSQGFAVFFLGYESYFK